jgi:3-oxoacyl-[acyl-carrier protein] reductase
MKTWLITGGGTGIGRATALRLATPDSAVVINYSRSADAAREVAEECARRGAQTLVLAGDVSRDEDCRAMAQKIQETFGRLDGLVNNAGTTRFAPAGDLEAVNADDFHAIYAVNVIGTWQMTRACAALLRQSRGAVVNVSSASALTGAGSSPAYSASKGALNTMTLGLARSLAPEVRVNAINPGFVETDWHVRGMGEARFDAVRQKVAETTALRATLVPDDLAQAIVWMLSQPLMTGQDITIDAGSSLGSPTSLLQKR